MPDRSSPIGGFFGEDFVVTDYVGIRVHIVMRTELGGEIDINVTVNAPGEMGIQSVLDMTVARMTPQLAPQVFGLASIEFITGLGGFVAEADIQTVNINPYNNPSMTL